ncbi:uncharacterized protein C8R40DRAFT_1170918 [Lentinula edodes]|uniref:uncharacterized protein n=1 Tax=Lentinula edodes TaxID=5353 RepID=UPI001E8D6943|nr:uncharacterized protein C8R40DRAFT_1170918 [Lentinula edodes]KAH7874816.1 hypothetical protein C8R40DRAFT_1170918 [Lentinula edodes]
MEMTQFSISLARAWQIVEVENSHVRDLDIIFKDNTEGYWVGRVRRSLVNKNPEESPRCVEIILVPVPISSITIHQSTRQRSAELAESGLPQFQPQSPVRRMRAIESAPQKTEPIVVDYFQTLSAFKEKNGEWVQFLDETSPGKQLKKMSNEIQTVWHQYLKDACNTKIISHARSPT